jgi:hypothetical protein
MSYSFDVNFSFSGQVVFEKILELSVVALFRRHDVKKFPFYYTINLLCRFKLYGPVVLKKIFEIFSYINSFPIDANLDPWGP